MLTATVKDALEILGMAAPKNRTEIFGVVQKQRRIKDNKN
jgi:hypothetical protein